MARVPVLASGVALILSSGCTSVGQSAHEGDLARVKAYVWRHRGAPEKRFDDGGCTGCTLLHYAAGNVRDDADLPRMLVEAGADVNAVDGGLGMTALHFACMNQNPAVVRYLLEAGGKASLEVRDGSGATPLHRAASWVKVRERVVYTYAGPVFGSQVADEPSPEVVTALLDAGADLGARTPKGNTALHLAAYRGFVRTASLLLARGADPAARNDDGQTPAELAARNGKEPVVKLLEGAAGR
jgi:ankyrin repeat protein